MPTPIGRAGVPVVPLARPTTAPAAPTATQPTASGPAPTRDAFAAQGPTLVTSIQSFNDRKQVTLGSPLKMVNDLDANGSDAGWHAELDIPLAQLGLGTGQLTKLSLGEPWRNEKVAGEPLPFTVSNGVVHITVPNANASRDAWGAKIKPAFAVEGSTGQRVLLEVQPKQVTRDTTALNKSQLQSSITVVQTTISTLQDSAARLRTFLADPTQTQLGPESSFVDGLPYRDYASQQIASEQQALKQTDAGLGPARTAAQAGFDGAAPTDKLAMVLETLVMSKLPGADATRTGLVAANNAAVYGQQKVVKLQQSLDDLRGLLPANQITQRETELAQAKTDAVASQKTFDDSLSSATAMVAGDDLLAMTNQLLGGNTLRPLLTAHSIQTETIALFQGALAKDLASSQVDAAASLPRVEKSISDEQAKLADYQQRLASPSQTMTVDIAPAQ